LAFLHSKVAMVIICMQPGVILKKGRVVAFKRLFNVLNKNKYDFCLCILTQDMLKEIEKVF